MGGAGLSPVEMVGVEEVWEVDVEEDCREGPMSR